MRKLAIFGIGVICLGLAESRAQAQMGANAKPPSAAQLMNRAIITKTRWLIDIPSLDWAQLARHREQQWCVLNFKPYYPGHPIVELQGRTDPKTNQVTVLPNSDSDAMFEGTFTVLSTFGNQPDFQGGKYRVKATHIIAVRHDPHSIATSQGSPLLQGGSALTRINQDVNSTDPKLFSPLYTLPSDWVPYLEEAVKGPSPTDGFDSKNPFWRLTAFLGKITDGKPLPASDFENVTNAIANAHGLERGLMLSALLKYDYMSRINNTEVLYSEEIELKQTELITKEPTPEDLLYMLLALRQYGRTSVSSPLMKVRTPLSERFWVALTDKANAFTADGQDTELRRLWESMSPSEH